MNDYSKSIKCTSCGDMGVDIAFGSEFNERKKTKYGAPLVRSYKLMTECHTCGKRDSTLIWRYDGYAVEVFNHIWGMAKCGSDDA